MFDNIPKNELNKLLFKPKEGVTYIVQYDYIGNLLLVVETKEETYEQYKQRL